jgi:hypothetical protein
VRTISVVGIGSGNPEHLTVQAIGELNAADVVFMMDKGETGHELLDVRREICDRYITGPTRIVTAPDPQRDRTAAAYAAAVDDWRARRADVYQRLISTELGPDQHGAFLASSMTSTSSALPGNPSSASRRPVVICSGRPVLVRLIWCCAASAATLLMPGITRIEKSTAPRPSTSRRMCRVLS